MLGMKGIFDGMLERDRLAAAKAASIFGDESEDLDPIMLQKYILMLKRKTPIHQLRQELTEAGYPMDQLRLAKRREAIEGY